MKFLWLASTVAILVAIVPNLVSGKKALSLSGSRRVNRCGRFYYGLGGSLKSPNWPRNYGNNMLCTWRIRVPRGKIVEVKFLDFQLEYHARCRYDYLELRDGSSASSTLMGKFCGSRRPSMMLARSGAVYITFRTDLSVTKRGFRIQWKAVNSAVGRCPNTRRALGLGGVVTTPHYPNKYGNNQLCVWKISAPSGKRIRLRIVDFKLEGGTGCPFDYVELRDGWLSFSHLIGKFCGIKRPWTVITSTNKLRIKFKSDASVTKKGMRAYFRAVH